MTDLNSIILTGAFAPIAISVVVLSLMGYEMYKDYKELKDYKG